MTRDLIEHLSEVVFEFYARLRYDPVFHDLNIVPLQARILAMIEQDPLIKQSQIVEQVNRDKAQIARLLKDLETDGLISRRTTPEDRRAACIVLTEKGRSVHKIVRGCREALLEEVTVGTTQADIGRTIALVSDIRSRINMLPSAGAGPADV